jgi:hypothetical protein
MFKSAGLALMAVVMSAGSVLCEEIAIITPEGFLSYAKASYSNISLTPDDRKKVMETMIEAADKWKDDYEMQWRTAEAIYAYGDTLYYAYQIENYETLLAKKAIRTTADVINKTTALSSVQSRTLLDLGKIGRKYADIAVKLIPEGEDGNYYNAMTIATYSFGKSIVKALLEGLGPKYEKHLNNILKTNKDYQNGSAYTAYGRYWYKLPWPKRSLKRSLEMFRIAEKYDPSNVVLLNFLGDTLYDKGDKTGAKQCWENILISNYQIYAGQYINTIAKEKLQYLDK